MPDPGATAISKHSLTIAGHRTSISLEQAFWEKLRDIAGARGLSLAARAIARETARIEAQEFDVHEHAVALARLESTRRQEADRLQAIEDVKRAVLRARARATVLEHLRQLLAAEKQKAAEKVAKTQPLAITPAPQATPAAPAAPSNAPQPAPADPSAAGRY